MFLNTVKHRQCNIYAMARMFTVPLYVYLADTTLIFYGGICILYDKVY